MCHTIKNPILQNGENPQFVYNFDLNDENNENLNYAELVEFEGEPSK
ncbi:unnamed protein product [Meloidogyne enterolobii]|uniref:Uncharacterized protein n=1 Tax=Meloidogyne enterolobii TaxID=390850 RepID=A0ACB1AHX2_MELEN